MRFSHFYFGISIGSGIGIDIAIPAKKVSVPISAIEKQIEYVAVSLSRYCLKVSLTTLGNVVENSVFLPILHNP